MPSWQCPSCHATVNADAKPPIGSARLCGKCHTLPPKATRSVQKTAKRRSGKAVPLRQVKKAGQAKKVTRTKKAKR